MELVVQRKYNDMEYNIYEYIKRTGKRVYIVSSFNNFSKKTEKIYEADVLNAAVNKFIDIFMKFKED